MTHEIVERLVQQFDMQPHPEGGYYHETYRASEKISRLSDGAVRASGTAIYYLLNHDAYSAWHRIVSDEIWHFYAGQPLLVHVLNQQGDLQTHRLGNPLQEEGLLCQVVVPAGYWFAAQLEQKTGFALAGCTVAPGFEFTEFELAEGNTLLSQYPQHANLIRQLLPRSSAHSGG